MIKSSGAKVVVEPESSQVSVNGTVTLERPSEYIGRDRHNYTYTVAPQPWSDTTSPLLPLATTRD